MFYSKYFMFAIKKVTYLCLRWNIINPSLITT